MNEKLINEVYDHMMDTITQVTEGIEGSGEGHFAIKLSGLVMTDLLKTISGA